jgi:LAO/AO transport system kinase
VIVGVADSDLVARVRQGDEVAIARMLSRVERSADGVDGELAELHRLSKPAHVVGVTGAPGSGKSTLVSSLAHEFSARGRQLGVLAVDPSSPYSGGSILGDRVRMLDLADDDAVFVRSMATRGAIGGLSRATADAVTVLTASGKDFVVIETVGVGQDEVEIMKIAHTIVVVSVPGLGDDIQALKAGLLEIADVHVVNKSDREGAQRTAAELRGALRLTAAHDDPSWRVPVHMTSATSGEGVGELAKLIEQHHEWLTDSGELEQRERRATASRVRALVLDELLRRLEDPTASREFDELIREVSERRTHPRAAAAEIIRRHMEVAP